jgi:YhcH/YjgK/YiaL family protein
MILDSIDNRERYLALHPLFRELFDYLLTCDIAALEEGQHYIIGDKLYVNVANAELRCAESAPLEVHNRYIDVQVVVEGEELFGWSERKPCTTPRGEFDTERDIQFFDDTPQTIYKVCEGQFTILYPEDAHAPLIGEGNVRKLIFKVLI